MVESGRRPEARAVAKKKKSKTQSELPAPAVARGVLVMDDEDLTGLDDSAMQELLQATFAEAEASEERREQERASLSDEDDGEEIDVVVESLVSGDDDDRPEISIERTGTEISISVGDTSSGLPSLSDDDAELGFPDHAYDPGPEDEDAEAAVLAAAERMVEELDLLRERVAVLTRREQETGVELRRREDENETLRRQTEAYKARLIKLHDEFEAYRPRAERERQASVQRETDAVLRSFLPVIDNMELALSHAQGNGSADGIAEGVVMILDQLHKTFQAHGVRAIEAERGGVFDPSLHEAMAREEDEELEPGRILGVLRAGYTVGDRLLRAARVSVVAGEPPTAGGSGSGSEREDRSEPGDPDELDPEDASLDDDQLDRVLEQVSDELRELDEDDDEREDPAEDPSDAGTQEG